MFDDYYDTSVEVSKEELGARIATLNAEIIQLRKAEKVLELARKLLRASSSALKSYQYGNASPDLAKEISEGIDHFLGE